MSQDFAKGNQIDIDLCPRGGRLLDVTGSFGSESLSRLLVGCIDIVFAIFGW